MKNFAYILLGSLITMFILYLLKDQEAKEDENLIKRKIIALYKTPEFKKLLGDKEFNELLQTKEFIDLGYIFGRDFVLDQLGLNYETR